MNRLVDTVREGEGGMTERTAWKHIHYHVKDKWQVGVFWVTLGAQPGGVGWGWEIGGSSGESGYIYICIYIYIYLWLIYVDVWQRPTQYYNVIIL